jgi:hypothetical protein
MPKRAYRFPCSLAKQNIDGVITITAAWLTYGSRYDENSASETKRATIAR